MSAIEISKTIDAERCRNIISDGLIMQFNSLDSNDINYLFYVKELQAVCLKYGLDNLCKTFENDK